MSLIVAAIGILLLMAPVLTAKVSLAPSAQLRIACVAVTSGILLLGIGSLLTASPLLLRWHDGAAISSVGMSHLSPGGPWAWTVGGALGAFGLAWILGALRRTVSARRRAALPRWAADTVAHDASAGAEVRVAPTHEPIAFAVPGRDRHVVVSRAVIDLPEPERRAVLAHEGAHLRLRHDRYLLVLAVYECMCGWIPGIRAAAASHRVSIERWADALVDQMSPLAGPALGRARIKLGACAETPLAMLQTVPSPKSSGWRVVGVLAIIVPLLIAGVYSATHSFGDFGRAVALLH